eukprot:TRINITY_DN7671_c0_g1_i1.p1 TRINITY_DN7671_c0_g1~~TRINITY_DN7671_c0_g1_i1.p1  ORF type:complete len:147 (+),score=55.27 TRINITY_DN7671_c0_g1_i1:29-469(+)
MSNQVSRRQRGFFDPIFESPFGMDFPSRGDTRLMRSEWMPELDICENEKEISVHTDLPGMKKEDIKVRIDKNVVTIEGERKEKKEEKGETFHRCERRCGKFTRSFTLPKNADTKTMKAKYCDGVLNICLQKKPCQKEEESMNINIE